MIVRFSKLSYFFFKYTLFSSTWKGRVAEKGWSSMHWVTPQMPALARAGTGWVCGHTQISHMLTRGPGSHHHPRPVRKSHSSVEQSMLRRLLSHGVFWLFWQSWVCQPVLRPASDLRLCVAFVSGLFSYFLGFPFSSLKIMCTSTSWNIFKQYLLNLPKELPWRAAVRTHSKCLIEAVSMSKLFYTTSQSSLSSKRPWCLFLWWH